MSYGTGPKFGGIWSSSENADHRAPEPETPYLYALAMKKAAASCVWDEGQKSLREPDRSLAKISAAINALPAPTPEAALAEAMKLPEVKAMREALTKLRDLTCEAIEDDDGNSGCGQCQGDCAGCIAHAALAALPKGDA